MAEKIPSDLHPSILTKLPSKALLKFLLVSKSWHNLIKSPYFTSSYHNHHKSLHNNQAFLFKAHSHCMIFRYRNPRGQRGAKLVGPPSDFNKIVGSHEGILCLSGTHHSNLMLWNPSLNVYWNVAPPRVDLSDYALVVGIGCNIAADEYKLVSIIFNEMNIFGDEEDSITTPVAQVYSVTNPSLGWTGVPLPSFDGRVSRMSQGCSVNDTVHWIVFAGDYDVDLSGLIDSVDSILTYDACTDSFGKMHPPKELEDVVNPNMTLAAIGGSLGAVYFPVEEEPGRSDVVVWRMEESWRVLYRVTLSSVSNKELWAYEDGKVFIATSCGKLIAVRGKKEGSDENVYFDGHRGMTGVQAFAYTESLVLSKA